MVFKLIFGMYDKMSYTGFMVMWSSFFFTSLGVMLADNSVGAPRNFCAVSQIICCTNLVSVGYGITNRKKLSEISMLTSGLDMFVTWTSLAYFGGSAVFSTTPIGIWNYVQVPIMGLMTVNSVAGLLACALNMDGYEEYLRNLTDDRVMVKSNVENFENKEENDLELTDIKVEDKKD